VKFLAVVLIILALAAALMFVGSYLRGDLYGQWVFGFMAVLLALAAGMVWSEGER
jgi:hypothetical protein